MSGDLTPGVRGGADAQTSSPKTASSPGALVDAFHAGIAAGPKPAPAEDLRVPGKPPDISALMPWMDVDHDPATATAPRRTPNPVASTTKRVAATTATTTTASTAAIPPDFAEQAAAMKASAFNLELEVLRLSGDPKARYKVQDVLERADDSLTRTKMKEQYAAANDGQTIDSMITSSKGLDERDKQHALGLMSDRRDAATDKLAAMDPKARAKLEDEAAVWADQLLHITRSDDRDDSDHADQIANILGSRKPEELEVIRSRVRLQTSGTERTTTYEELDRTFTGRDKDIVLAGLTGSPTHLASTRLVDAAMEGDPARIHRILKELKPEKLAELRKMNPVLLAQVASSMPAEYRAEIEAALGGREPEAEGARIASLLQPVEFSVADTRDAAKTKRLLNRKEAQEPERMIEELGKMSAADLEAARDAWDKGNPGKSWDALIGERYKDAESTVRLRIEAAARGDNIGERALRLRQGMRTFDQQLIDGALYNPDLKSEDPTKRNKAETERRELEARMHQYDAGDQRTKAMLEGKATTGAVVGRSTDEQLDAYYEQAKDHDTEASGDVMDIAEHAANKDERMGKVREKANVDRYAAKEMSREGEAHASTKVRRAELSGNALGKAEILERLDGKKTEGSNNTLEAQGAEYRMKFGARDMLAAPELSSITDAADAVAMLTGDERPPHEIAAELSRDNMDVGELRVEHVRETGVLADRTREQRLEQQKEVRDLTQSGWLGGSEQMRFLRGGNRGSEDLLDSSINLMERGNADGADDREQSRRDRSTTQAVDLQREEKQREAAKVAQVISIAAKIAAIATANPALFVAVDAGFGLLRVAANELIANEANDATSDFKHAAVDVGVNLATAGFGRWGKGLQAGTQAAKGVQMAQRFGNAGAAMAGAAAHSEIDGEAGGGAVLRAALGAVLPGYFRGKAENAITGTGRVANTTRAGLGTVTDVASNVTISGGHLDSASLIDAAANTAQGHGHATAHGAKRKPPTGDAGLHPYGHYADDLGPSYAGAHDRDHKAELTNVDHTELRRASERPADPRYADIDDHAVRVKSAAETPTHVYAHYSEDVSSVFATAPQGGATDAPSRTVQGLPTASTASFGPADTSDASRAGPETSASPTRTPGDPHEHKRALAERMQKRANTQRAAGIAAKQDQFTEIDQLGALATGKDDWDDIRKMEHAAKRPVSERYSPHDEIAALQQYERAGGLQHADGTQMTPDEARAWIARTRAEFQPSVDAKTAEHSEAVRGLTRQINERIAQRDAIKTDAIVAKARTAPVDERNRRIVPVNEAISLGVGGAGASGAKQGQRDMEAEPVTRTDRMGVENAKKPELWNGLGDKPAGQPANVTSYGTDGYKTSDVAEHPTAQVARASEIALHVASQRNDSQIGTIGSQGPVGELQIKRIELPDGRQVLEVGVPVTMDVDGVEQVVVLTTVKGVDISSGMGEAKQLTTERTQNADDGRLAQISDDDANAFRTAGALLTGEQALAAKPEQFDGKRVLGIGGGPTSEWVAEHAVNSNASNVQVVGQLPKPDPKSKAGLELATLEAEIRGLATAGLDVAPALTQQHHQMIDAHIATQELELAKIATKLDGAKGASRERLMAEQTRIKHSIDPFLGSRVDRNHAVLNNDKIQHAQADVMFMKPAADGVGIEVTFTDGTRTVVDKVVPSIGADHNAPGGVNAMLRALPEGVDMIPVIAQGRVVGLESNPPGLTISGAALTGTLGHNMPSELLTRIPPEMRDAFMTSVIDHAERGDVSDDSRGIIPGIENVGQNPALMQEALAKSPKERSDALQHLLDDHLANRVDNFGGAARFDERQLFPERRKK